MTTDEFLAMDRSAQNSLLLEMAANALAVLSDFPNVYLIAERSYSRAERYASGEPIFAYDIAQDLNHSDLDQDLGMQIYHVDGKVDAIAAIDIICYAVGAVGRQAYVEQDMQEQMPEPVAESTPEIVAESIYRYDILVQNGLVPPIS